MPDVSKASHVFKPVSTAGLGKSASPAREERGAREHVLNKMDGRTLRAKGRTVAVNYKVRPEFKEDLIALAKELNLPMVDVLEAALAEYKAKVKGGN